MYVITVQPRHRYGSFLAKIDNWFTEQRVFYVGEGMDLYERLATHVRTVRKLVEEAEREAGENAADISMDAFGLHAIPIPKATTPRPGQQRTETDFTLPERLLLEHALAAALRPPANGLNLRSSEAARIWEELKPDTSLELWEGLAPWLTWDIVEKFGANDPAADPETQGHGHLVTDEETFDMQREASEEPKPWPFTGNPDAPASAPSPKKPPRRPAD